MKHEPDTGTKVLVAWGLGEPVRAEVDHVYGPPGRRHVLVWLDPAFSGPIVSERVTLSVPLDAVEEVTPAA